MAGAFKGVTMKRKFGFALLVLGMPAAASAAQDSQPQAQVDAVIQCLNVASVDERVRCYDRAATALRESLRTGDVAVVDRSEQRRREGRREGGVSNLAARVRVAAPTGNGGWRLTLDNGHIWQTAEPQRRPAPPAGTVVRVDRNIIGSYFLSIPGYPRARVFRIE